MSIRGDGGTTALGLERLMPDERARRIAGWVVPIALLAVMVTIWPFPAPFGIILNGALVGGRIALIALGIALVYRANRVVNFAQGDLGQVPTTLVVLLVLSLGWNYWLSLSIGLVAAIVLGALIEILIIRRFFRAPRLILTVATIGVAQLLTGAALFLPTLFDDLRIAPRLEPPFELSFTFGEVVFHANDILTMIFVPVCFVALGLFLTRSNIGTAVRAAAERADRASTLGIPVKRLHTIVWVIASVLAFVAMTLRAGSVGLPVGQVLGPSFLVAALAAAVLGRMERLPTIACAAIGIGILDQSMTFQPGNDPAFNDAVLFLVVMIGLFVTRRATGGARVGEMSTWQAAREIRPIPRELAPLPEVRIARIGGLLLIVAALVALPLWLPESKINLAAVIAIFAIIGISLVVLTGWAGQVSLGQMAFAGIGAAVGGAVTARLHYDLGIAMLAGGIVGALIAIVIGYPAIRRRGLTLAVITLAFALMTSSYLLNQKFFGDILPIDRVERADLFGVIDISSETRYYYLCLVALALMYIVARGIRRSRTGRVLVAIRENDRAASSYGINTVRTTLAAFAVSGFMAAFAGVLFVHHQNQLGISAYLPDQSLQVFSMVVIGGLGSLVGAILGATYVRGAEYFLAPEWRFLATGAGLLLVLMVLPGGLGAALADIRDGLLRWVARRRNLLVPSLVADRRVEPIPTEALAEAAEAAQSVEEVEVPR